MTKCTTRKSGGVIIYVREEYSNDDTFVLKYNDSHVWIKLGGRLFNFKKDIFLCVCYIVPENSSRHAFIDSNIYDIFLENMIHISIKLK